MEQPSQVEGDDYWLKTTGSVKGRLTGVNGGTTSLGDSVILEDTGRFCKKYHDIVSVVKRAPGDGNISGWLDSWIGKINFNGSKKKTVLKKMELVKKSNC